MALRSTVKSILRRVAPRAAVNRYRDLRSALDARRNRRRSTEEVFTQIYESNSWGGKDGEFDSGTGTSDTEVVRAYVKMLQEKAETEGFKDRVFVDLGCGDFRVGQQLTPLASKYIGIDIVKPLIRRNQQRFGNESTRFESLNIAEDPLPEGDVCFVRQVLQHLSNAQAAAVLKKLEGYRWVFITEHYPSENPNIVPNIDKVHGADVRVTQNSGIYLDQPPFSLPPDRLEEVLEVGGVGLDAERDPGVIRTYLYRPR